LKRSIKAVAASGNLSTGFREESLVAAMRAGPSVLGCDAGSTDSGPYYLGSGKPRGPRQGVKRNLRIMLREALRAGVPMVIGTAGHAGGRPHLRWTTEIIREIALEQGWHFRLAAIDSELEKAALAAAFARGEVRPLSPAPALSEETILGAERLVAMMGVEPIQRALRAGAQVIVCGRCSDVAIYAALPLLEGVPASVAFHAGKILECGAAAVAQRMYPDSMMAELQQDGFRVEPPNPELRCTPQSVSAHTLYENADPYLLIEPGGVLDVSGAQYRALNSRAVFVSGSRFTPSEKYTVRIEGAALAGYRSIVIAGIRDPLVLRQLPQFLSSLRVVVERKIAEVFASPGQEYTLNFRVYGGDGSMGELEPVSRVEGHEAGLVIDVVAASQSLASDILPLVWHTALHHPIPEYEGMVSNLAFPFSPPGIDVGPVYRFCANHVWELSDPCAPFQMQVEEV
jgi:hypothetical protein